MIVRFFGEDPIMYPALRRRSCGEFLNAGTSCSIFHLSTTS